jgi:hypothetical protein
MPHMVEAILYQALQDVCSIFENLRQLQYILFLEGDVQKHFFPCLAVMLTR